MSRRIAAHVPMPYWAAQHYAPLVGTTGSMFGRYLNGLSYPTLQMMQKFEVVFGWPVREQVDLIPPFWTWPDQAQHAKGVPQQDPHDLRYSMKLQQILREWSEANPRTQLLQEIRLHPAIGDKRKRER